jgi:glycosyltransferase involved in cell wall biosynthesis
MVQLAPKGRRLSHGILMRIPSPSRIDVIIPAYNASRWIQRAVESVLHQSHRECEVIVVDDGSLDSTPEMLDAMGNQIRWIRQPNRGIASARNRGLSMASGEFVMFLDADDWIFPDKLAHQLLSFSQTPSPDWVYCDIQYVDENDRFLYKASDRFAYIKRSRLEGNLFPELFHGNFIPIHAPLFRRKCLDDVGHFDENPDLLEDWDLLLRISVRAIASFIPKTLAACRIHSDSHSSDAVARERRTFATLDKARQLFPQHIRAMGATGRRAVANIHNRYGYAAHDRKDFPEACRRLAASIAIWPFQGKAPCFYLVSFLQKMLK